MPIFVQWKWEETSKTFLAIFHFDDDYSKVNIRTERMRFRGVSGLNVYYPDEVEEKAVEILSRADERLRQSKVRNVLTWAPHHYELALLMDLLNYANMVNGLKEHEKRELRNGLQLLFEGQTADERTESIKNLRECVPSKLLYGLQANYRDKTVNFMTCVELCPEYIDYLKEILKPYL